MAGVKVLMMLPQTCNRILFKKSNPQTIRIKMKVWFRKHAGFVKCVFPGGSCQQKYKNLLTQVKKLGECCWGKTALPWLEHSSSSAIFLALDLFKTATDCLALEGATFFCLSLLYKMCSESLQGGCTSCCFYNSLNIWKCKIFADVVPYVTT